MKITQRIRNIEKKIVDAYSKMNSKQKLLSTILFLIVMFIFVKLASNMVAESRNDDIDYSYTGNDFYIFSTYLDDDDTFVLLKSIADDVISKCMGYQIYDSKTITLDDIYSDVLYTNYQNSVNKSNFKKVANSFIEKVNIINENNLELIPTSIVIYEESYYLVKYTYELDSEINLYVGIILDTNNNKYYIWYLE